MISHLEISDVELKRRIKSKLFTFGGNAKLKIYGMLHCEAGKKMKKQNRVFFVSEKDAVGHGYRPCGHCMRNEYKKWKDDVIC